MRAQQPKLELGRQLLGDRAVDEAAEPGVYAVGVLAPAVRGAFDELARGAHLLARRIGERRGLALDGDRPDVGDRQVVAGEGDRGLLGHAASLALPGLRLTAVEEPE